MSEPVTYTQHSKAVRELLQLHKEGRLKLAPLPKTECVESEAAEAPHGIYL